MTAATVPEALKRCPQCERRPIPIGRPRYWQAWPWPASERPHLIYSVIDERLKEGVAALTACRLVWRWPLAKLDQFSYLFPGMKRAPAAPAKPRKYGPTWRD